MFEWLYSNYCGKLCSNSRLCTHESTCYAVWKTGEVWGFFLYETVNTFLRGKLSNHRQEDSWDKHFWIPGICFLPLCWYHPKPRLSSKRTCNIRGLILSQVIYSLSKHLAAYEEKGGLVLILMRPFMRDCFALLSPGARPEEPCCLPGSCSAKVTCGMK